MSTKTLLFDANVRRDGGSGNGQTDDLGADWWWTSPTAYAVKWSIIAGIFILFLTFFLGGYLHAQRRMKRGLAPLGYHRWLVTSRQRTRFEPPPQNDLSFYRTQDGYAMHGYAPPPPAYNPDGDNVPEYTPPEGGALKAKPAQSYAEIPPPGPPPSHSEEAPSYKGPVVTVTPPEASSSSDPR